MLNFDDSIDKDFNKDLALSWVYMFNEDKDIVSKEHFALNEAIKYGGGIKEVLMRHGLPTRMDLFYDDMPRKGN